MTIWRLLARSILLTLAICFLAATIHLKYRILYNHWIALQVAAAVCVVGYVGSGRE